MTTVRKVYQKAILVPTNHVEQLWKDYENFENSVSRTLVIGISLWIFIFSAKKHANKSISCVGKNGSYMLSGCFTLSLFWQFKFDLPLFHSLYNHTQADDYLCTFQAKGLLSEYQPKFNSAKAVYRERKKFIDDIDWNLLATPPTGSYKVNHFLGPNVAPLQSLTR
jgi:hypothetical protein